MQPLVETSSSGPPIVSCLQVHEYGATQTGRFAGRGGKTLSDHQQGNLVDEADNLDFFVVSSPKAARSGRSRVSPPGPSQAPASTQALQRPKRPKARDLMPVRPQKLASETKNRSCPDRKSTRLN